MTNTDFTSVKSYLAALRRALLGLPNAVIRDALSDTEEHLRSELAQHPGKSEAEVMAGVIENFGTPQEIAEEYRARENAYSKPIMRAPAQKTGAGFFGIIADPQAYGALIYMLLSLATGVFYFTWVVTGISLTAGLSILIIGIPVALLFIASVRILSLIEGRIVESLLGVRMPRRLPPQDVAGETLWVKIKNAVADIRTWSSMVYLALMLPLGTAYFTGTVTLLALSLGLTFGPLFNLLSGEHIHMMELGDLSDIPAPLVEWLVNVHDFVNSPVGIALCVAAGVLLFFITMHLARLVGRIHGLIAEALLVRV